MIETVGLTRRFGDLVAVDHVSLQVEKGEVFGLLGPNGAGKSTTMRMLCTLLRPTEGSARVAGHDIVRDAAEVRKRIGWVAEKIILYDHLTAMENLRLFGRLYHMPGDLLRRRADELLDLVQMDEWRDKKVGTFSTGMRQRINLARALLHQPDVLFLDEPTLGLDPQTSRSIREVIKRLGEGGVTMVLTTHIMVEADMLCRRIGVIDHGRVVALDTSHNLKRLVSNGDTAVIDLGIANLGPAIVERLRGADGVTSVVKDDETRVKVHARGAGALDSVIDAVRSSGGLIQSIATAEPTLEDVFIHLTGRAMRGEATEKVPSAHRMAWGRHRGRVR